MARVFLIFPSWCRDVNGANLECWLVDEKATTTGTSSPKMQSAKRDMMNDNDDVTGILALC